MAETYKTNVFTPTPPAPAATPQAPGAPAPPPAQTGGENYTTDVFKPPPTKPADQTGGGASQGGGPASQPPPNWQDLATLYGNEWAMHTIPGLRMQAEAARQRVGPAETAAAETAGSATSPSQLLNYIPYVGAEAGPFLAGGVHEGVKSYMDQPDWVPQGKNLEKVVGDASMGAIAGYGAGKVAQYAPKVLPPAAQYGFKIGPAGGLTHLIHQYTGSIGADMAGFAGAYKALDWAGDKVGQGVKSIASSPVTQQAIRSLIMGGGSAARNYAGPYDQWIPGQ